MATNRRTVALAVLVIVVLVVSSLGLLSAVGGTAGPTRVSAGSAPLSAVPAGASSASPASPSASKGLAPTPPAGPSTLSVPSAPLSSTNLSGSAATPLGSQILHSLAAKGVPLHDIYLPYLLNSPHPALTNQHVGLTYTSSPAPYGIGEFGLRNVSGVITPYTLSTPSVEANFSTLHLSGYSPDISGPDQYGVQLNAVLNNVTLLGSTGYQFWTQNVFLYYPALNKIEFVSNIWNFSNPTVTLSCNFLYQTNGNNLCPYYYYGVSSLIPASGAFGVQLYLNSTVVNGRDAVWFNYSVSSSLGTFGGTYNYAIFNSLAPGGNPALTPTPEYVANGFQYNPVGLPNDFEVTLGGPGGGSNFDVFESAATYMSLQYYNTSLSAYLTVPSAYNVGGETGETSVGVNAAWSQFGTTGAFPARCVECVTLSNGPSFQYGLWGVGGHDPAGNVLPEISWYSQSGPYLVNSPSNAFVFLAEGDPFTTWTGTNWSLFQWTPNFAPYTYSTDLPIGNYTEIVILAEHNVFMATFSLWSNNAVTPLVQVTDNLDTTYGVDTPLWAFNATGVAAISSGTDAFGNSVLYNNQYAQIGQLPTTSSAGFVGNAAYFPWFGAFNDYGFPVFPGILLNGVSQIDVANAPSFGVSAPPGTSYQRSIQYFGWPETNHLQMFFWQDSYINLTASTVTGWWPAAADFGPSQSFANAVFWNTTLSTISGNTFATGGMALFMYGGSYNVISTNFFLTETPPIEANPYATAAAYFGSIGLVEADLGDAALSVPTYTCTLCDHIYNNAFETIVTASSLQTDPYTGAPPNEYPYGFSQAWNTAYTPGVTNIIGGDYLGGNYWWDYGYAHNPYGVLPDQELNYLPYVEFGALPGAICTSVFGLCDYGSGDYYPLVNVPLYHITFKEQGLPAGVGWGVYVYVPPVYTFQGFYAQNGTTAPYETNFTEHAGSWDYYPYSADQYFSPTSSYGVVTVDATTGNVVVTIVFETAFVLTVKETGLPAGTPWWAETYNSSTGYHYNYSVGTENNISGQIAGTYTWWAGGATGYANVPGHATVTMSANATVDVTFVPIYWIHVQEVGLPSGSVWTFTLSDSAAAYNYWWWNTGDWTNFTAPDLTYNWSANSAGYVGAPQNGTLTLSANTTLTITFAAAVAITFVESGLAAGTPWTVTLTQGTSVRTLGGTGNSITFDTVEGAYTYTVSASGYAAIPSSGGGTLSTNAAVAVTFSLATGTLKGTVNPSGATLWVDGAKQTLGSGGAFSLTLPVGVHSIEVADGGYVTYFNNVTVPFGTSVTLNIVLSAVPTTASGFSGINTDGWLLIALLAALAAIFLVTTVIFSRRGRQPPPVAQYNAAPPAVAGAPPTGPSQPWQESPPPPPGAG